MPRIERGLNEQGQTRLERLWAELRAERNKRIADTDYLLASDYPLDNVKLNFVKTYRQELRDITKKAGAPWDGGGANTPWPVLES